MNGTVQTPLNAGFARRLTLALALLLLAFGAFVALLVRQVSVQAQDTSAQRLAHGLAQHIVAHWPEVRSVDEASAPAREALLRMLATVNPGIQVYLLDADGSVAHYIGQPGMVRTPRVDLAAVQAFLQGAPAPLRGTDPMGGPPRPFSAAMFPPQPGQARPPGYLYVVLQDLASAAPAGTRPAWLGAAWAVGIALGATLGLGAAVLWRLTLPLHRLARRMASFDVGGAAAASPGLATPPLAARDEVGALTLAFERLAARVAEQLRAREAQGAAHRELMANVAHDLRTPLTALHGHLEALAAPVTPPPPQRQALLHAALGQSDKVRRLTQQLFELATLQSTEELPQREPFRLDELVSDTVQKFDPQSALAERGAGAGAGARPPPRVSLVAPGTQPIVLDGDLHLIERALSNLIDNALRHGGGALPVEVSLHRDGDQVQVRVSDGGPGLPAELARRLDAGQPVREPPRRRPGGGIGGLGLAIAQRVAVLHGGCLRTLPAAGRGTLLALVLPLPAAPAAAG